MDEALNINIETNQQANELVGRLDKPGRFQVHIIKSIDGSQDIALVIKKTTINFLNHVDSINQKIPETNRAGFRVFTNVELYEDPE